MHVRGSDTTQTGKMMIAKQRLRNMAILPSKPKMTFSSLSGIKEKKTIQENQVRTEVDPKTKSEKSPPEFILKILKEAKDMATRPSLLPRRAAAQKWPKVVEDGRPTNTIMLKEKNTKKKEADLVLPPIDAHLRRRAPKDLIRLKDEVIFKYPQPPAEAHHRGAEGKRLLDTMKHNHRNTTVCPSKPKLHT